MKDQVMRELTRELIGLSYSPWTEKARWALDHHHIPYHYKEHLIIFGDPLLRYKLKNWLGEVTVPALICKSPEGIIRLGDSWDIALYADRIGNETTLFPKKYLEKIADYNRLSESALDAARALVMDRMWKNRKALQEALPSFVPEFLKHYLSSMAKVGIYALRTEFKTSTKTLSQHFDTLRNILLELQRELKKTASGYLLGDFSYADIAMALVLHGVLPAHHEKLKISPEIKKSWFSPELQKEFSELLEWRDQLYAKHRS